MSNGYQRYQNYGAAPQSTANFANLVKFFNTGKSSGKRVDLRVNVEGVNFYIYPAGIDSKNRGYLYVKRGGDYLGKIAPNGDYFGHQALHLAAVNSDPLAICIKCGKETGMCCFCGKELTDGRSVAMGYGPVCATTWGLPWGEETVQPEIDLMDLKNMLPDEAAETDNLYHSLAGKVPMTATQMASCIMQEVQDAEAQFGAQSWRGIAENAIIALLTQHPIIAETKEGE